MKICRKCRELKELTEFYKSDRIKDGKHSYCKTCNHLEVQKSYRKNLERRLLQEKERRLKDPHRLRKYGNANKYKWMKNNREKVRAHLLAQQNKKFLKSDRCESCGNAERLHMHHQDYSRPKSIVTLCISCHESVHHRKLVI